MNTVALKAAIARPRCVLLNISAYTAATTLNGHAPNSPAKKRHIKMVCRSLPAATATLNTENPKEAIRIGSLRPYNSDIGAHIYIKYQFRVAMQIIHRLPLTNGPKAYPKTNKLVPNVATSLITPNSLAT